jgi:multicomponent Na+:H+ antiporter subunit C
MEVIPAIVIGVLYAAGFYMMMQRSIFKLILGLGLLGHAANLFIFTIGRLTWGNPPVMGHEQSTLQGIYADPLPQAFILTAIVIGFGVQAFATVLVKRAYQTVGMDSFDQMVSTDNHSA